MPRRFCCEKEREVIICACRISCVRGGVNTFVTMAAVQLISVRGFLGRGGLNSACLVKQLFLWWLPGGRVLLSWLSSSLSCLRVISQANRHIGLQVRLRMILPFAIVRGDKYVSIFNGFGVKSLKVLPTGVERWQYVGLGVPCSPGVHQLVSAWTLLS